jgi:segregation and condensation protein A
MSEDLLHLDPDRDPADVLVLNLEAWEGPLDVLLHLAREQKVDLASISILALVDQYIAFVKAAKRLRIELAADYLVMAAWLAYLKSKILLPKPKPDDEGDGQQVVRDLTFHLRRLAAIRDAGEALMERPRLGQWRFTRGYQEPQAVVEKVRWTASLHDLLSAYGRIKTAQIKPEFNFRRPHIISIEACLERLRGIISRPIPLWTELATFLPPDLQEPEARRSGMASTLVAALELARSGRLDLSQEEPFGPILLKSPDEARGDLL